MLTPHANRSTRAEQHQDTNRHVDPRSSLLAMDLTQVCMWNVLVFIKPLSIALDRWRNQPVCLRQGLFSQSFFHLLVEPNHTFCQSQLHLTVLSPIRNQYPSGVPVTPENNWVQTFKGSYIFEFVQFIETCRLNRFKKPCHWSTTFACFLNILVKDFIQREDRNMRPTEDREDYSIEVS